MAPPPTAVFEGSFYIGIVVAAMLYGLQFAMFCQSTYFQLKGPRQDRKGDRFYIAYGAIILVLITFATSANAVYGQLMWIEHRDYPGGPAAYFMENASIWVQTLGSAADVTGNVMGDALLLYRCYIIFGSKLWVIIGPTLIFVLSTVMAIITVVMSGLPNANLFRGAPVNFGIIWISATVGFNVIVTVMISARLLMARKSLQAVGGPEFCSVYTGAVAILVESSAPFSILGIIFVILFAKSMPEEFFFSNVWGSFCTLSPQIIILRVSMGAAWNKDTVSQITTHMAFAESEYTTSTTVGLHPPAMRSRSRTFDTITKGSSSTSFPDP